MNEKYGIELDLLMSSFNKKAEQVKKTAESIKKAFNPSDVSGMKINGLTQIKGISKEFNKLTGSKYGLSEVFELQRAKTDLSDVVSKVKEVNKATSNMNYVQYDSNAIQQYIDQYGQVENKVKKTTNEVKKFNNENKKTTKINNGLNQITRGFDQITSKIKRFGLALLSIRGIWQLVSKASSAYLAQDTELSDKLQSVWAGLGSMLAPIIEKIANILMKGVGYINIFIKALTGVDLLAKASAKSMDKASKSAKGLNKSLAGFDELNNLDTSAGSNIDTGISNPFASIQNVDLPWAETVKAFGEWVKENMPTVIGLLGGLTGAIIAFKLGLGGIKSIGIGVVIFGVIKLIGDLINYLNDPSWENFGKIIQDIGIIIVGFGLIIGSIPVIIAGVLTIIVGLIVSNWEKIKGFLQNGIDWLMSKTDWVKENFGIVGEYVYLVFVNMLQEVLNTCDDLFKGVKNIFDGIIKLVKGAFTGDWKMAWEGVKQIFKGVFDSLGAIVKFPLNLIISALNTLINGANKIKFDVPNWVPGFGGKKFGFNIPQIPRLNVGTNYVPEDQLAYIHKGEAVVPKKFNSKEYFGNGNEQTNELIERVIEAIENIEIAPYTTIKDVGQASVKYINNKNRQLGRSVI